MPLVFQKVRNNLLGSNKYKSKIPFIRCLHTKYYHNGIMWDLLSVSILNIIELFLAMLLVQCH